MLFTFAIVFCALPEFVSPEEGLEPQLADIAALPVKLLRHMLPRYSQGVVFPLNSAYTHK